MKVFSSTNGTTPLVTVSASDMTNLYDTNTIQGLADRQWIRVEVTATADSGVTPLVYLHQGLWRVIMHDDGVHGGATVAGDKVYSAYLRIGAAAFKHVHLDALDAATLNNLTNVANYSSVIWSPVFRSL